VCIIVCLAWGRIVCSEAVTYMHAVGKLAWYGASENVKMVVEMEVGSSGLRMSMVEGWGWVVDGESSVVEL
jgi:hypothetical protein